MLNFQSHSFLLSLVISLFLSSICCHSSNGALSFHSTRHTIHTQGERENCVVLRGMKRSSLLEKTRAEPWKNSSVALAAQRTHRKDPLNQFRHYKGGWNISDKHYFSSVGFTGAPLFITAAIWFPGFGFSLLFISLYHCCCNRLRYGYSKNAYASSLIILVFLTIFAFVGCIVLYTGQGKLHKSTTDTMGYVLDQASVTVNTLQNVSQYLAAAKRIGVDQFALPLDVQNIIDKMLNKINASTRILEQQTENNSENIQNVLDSVRIALIIVAAAMLLVASLGFLFSVLGMQFLVNLLTILGWIFVTGTFILCGMFLVLHNIVGDTCFAMLEWVHQPVPHTALDNILPCADNATAQGTLSESRDVTFHLGEVVNHFVTNMSNANYLPNAGDSYYNQSGPMLPLFCNPYNADHSDRKCASGEVDFSHAGPEWKKYVCRVSWTGICTTMGRLTPVLYDQITAAVNLSCALYHYGPFLVSLEDCSFVRKAFSDIHRNQCPGLSHYSKLIYIGLVIVSAAVMLLLLSWAIYTRARRHRSYTERLIAAAASTNDPLGQKGP